MADDQQQPQPQAPPDLNAAIQALIQQQIAAASGQGNQVQMPQLQQQPSIYSNDPSKGPGLLSRIGLALGGGSLPGAPAELREQMGANALMNFGVGLMGAGRFATPGEVLAGGFRGAQSGLLGSEAAQAGQQEYALNAQTKLAELGMEQQKNRTAALTALVPLLQMQGRLGLPLFGGGPGGLGAPPGGGPGNLATIARDPSVETAGEQANNPGNLMSTDAPGQVGVIPLSGGRTLAAFPNVPTGVAANAANLAAYQTKYGINTVADAVKRWVSDPKADLTSYTNDVAKALGVKPTDPIDLTNPAVQRAFILAQQPHETGGKKAWLNPADVDAGIKIAQSWRQGGPPGGLATAPTGPYKPTTAPPAAAGPPGVQMGGEPPAPPGGPAGAAPGAYAGGGIGAVLNPNAAPATVAAPAGSSGKRAAADAILQGMQTAQATPVVRGTGLEAGPGGAVATLAQPAAPTPQPGWGAQVGSYNFGAPVGPVTAPPVQPQQPPAQPAQPPQQPPTPPVAPPAQPSRHDLVMEKNPDGTYKMPSDQVSQNEFLERERTTYSPQELQARGVILPDNPAEAQAKFAAVQKANATADAARTAASALYGTMKDPADAIRQVNAANEQAQKANQDYATYIQGSNEKNAEALQKIYQQQDDRNASAYKTSVLDPRNKAAELKQQGQQQIELAHATAGETRGTEALKDVNAKMAAASDRIDQIQLLHGLSANVGNATGIGDMKIGGRSLADLISLTGLGPEAWQEKASAVQAFRNGILNLTRGLREGGAATGEPRSNQDLNFVLGMAPSELQDPRTREAILTYLEQVNQRHLNIGAETSRLMQTYLPGTKDYMPYGQALLQAREKYKDFVPQMDAATAADPVARTNWASSLPDHSFFRDPSGNMHMWPPPAASQQTQPPAPTRSRGPQVGYGNQ